VKERPILFSGPMVRALLDGTKTQTRRVVKAKHLPFVENLLGAFLDGRWNQRPLPYGQPGDRLWVREAWAPEQYDAEAMSMDAVDASVRMPAYRADFSGQPAYKWRPSIHMPRVASRILLEVTGLRVQRLQEIGELDARAEGAEPNDAYAGPAKNRDCGWRNGYRILWEQINGPGSWAANPWVWVIEFKRVTP
jgi:hypothetical protein